MPPYEYRSNPEVAPAGEIRPRLVTGLGDGPETAGWLPPGQTSASLRDSYEEACSASCPPTEGRAAISSHFTLLELIVVLGVLGVLLALSAPSLRGFLQGRRTTEEARLLVATTRFAASEAVSSGDIMQLCLDPEAQAYSLRAITRCSENGGTVKVVELPSSVLLNVEADGMGSDGCCRINWTPDGLLDAGGDVVVSLVGRSNRDDRINLVPGGETATFVVAEEDVR